MDFGDDRYVGAVARGFERRTHASESRAQDEDIVIV